MTDTPIYNQKRARDIHKTARKGGVTLSFRAWARRMYSDYPRLSPKLERIARG